MKLHESENRELSSGALDQASDGHIVTGCYKPDEPNHMKQAKTTQMAENTDHFRQDGIALSEEDLTHVAGGMDLRPMTDEELDEIEGN